MGNFNSFRHHSPLHMFSMLLYEWFFIWFCTVRKRTQKYIASLSTLEHMLFYTAMKYNHVDLHCAQSYAKNNKVHLTLAQDKQLYHVCTTPLSPPPVLCVQLFDAVAPQTLGLSVLTLLKIPRCLCVYDALGYITQYSSW